MDEKHYSIGEFANMTGLSTYTLRYYEQEDLIVPQRDENNRRYYTVLDLKWIGFLLHLKGTGMTMEQIEDYVSLRKQGDQTIDERIDLLKNVQKDSLAKIEEMQKNLKVLSDKINWYEGKKNNTINDDFETYQNRINQGDQKDE
ncbi:MerR family transcriptional regulator [Lactobacillus sp. S2-2]|uniref:MerR family transcriptional regulator n=1 Tax=Lactobacillus sp. S2-2 TaxID=2692917 RepID=UPI001F2FED78|nr:MerR family transcriptional regulator [Lactobacillus sp. S2-2]MCF6515472.1 MerR family transcriptional regulator [Lactobacillus sp. S2-2]